VTLEKTLRRFSVTGYFFQIALSASTLHPILVQTFARVDGSNFSNHLTVWYVETPVVE
jgi:hypothetical protein